MNGRVTVDDTLSSIWKLLKVNLKSSLIRKNIFCNYVWWQMLTRFIMVIISQNKYWIIIFILETNIMLYVNYTSIKKKGWPWLISKTFFFFFFRATPMTYRSSQARGRIGAAVAGLHHSHSHTRPEPMSATYTTADGNAGSLTHWVGSGIEPVSSLIFGSLPLSHDRNPCFKDLVKTKVDKHC